MSVTQDEQDQLLKSVKRDPIHDAATCAGHAPVEGPMGLTLCGAGCILEVAADSSAVKSCLTAWIERLMLEEGPAWESAYYAVIVPAKADAFAAVLTRARAK